MRSMVEGRLRSLDPSEADNPSVSPAALTIHLPIAARQ